MQNNSLVYILLFIFSTEQQMQHHNVGIFRLIRILLNSLKQNEFHDKVITFGCSLKNLNI